MFIQVSRVKDAITGSYNGVAFGVMYTKEKYEAMKALEAEASTVKTPDELQAVIDKFKPLTEETFKELAESKSPYIYVNHGTGKFYLKLRGKVSSQPMPQALAERIIKSVEEGIEFSPLIKAWIRFLRIPQFRKNPSLIPIKGEYFANYLNRTYTDSAEVSLLMKESGLSHEKATELATRLQTPITQEGLLVTYKVVTELTKKFVLDAEGNKKEVPRWEATIDEDSGLVTYKEPEHVEDRVFEPAVQHKSGDAFSSIDLNGQGKEGHTIRVGNYHELSSWDMVNITDGVFGAKGLHAGNLDYIRNYQHPGTVTLNIFIDPMHIGRFTDLGDGAVVVKKYFAYGAFHGPNRGIYHSSDYAKLNDKEYEDMLEASLKDFGELDTKVEDARQLAQDISSTDLD